MRINQLRFLVALGKYKTISRVSKELMISQPSITTAIKNLEEELGFEILVRNKNKIAFTELGQKVLEKSEIILTELDSIPLLKNTNNNDLVGSVVVGSAPFFSSNFILDSMFSLNRDFPGICVEITQHDSGRLLKLLSVNEINMALVLIHKGYEESYFLEVKKII